MSRFSSLLIALVLATVASRASAQGVPASRLRAASAPAASSPARTTPAPPHALAAPARINSRVDRAQTPSPDGGIDPNMHLNSLELKSTQGKMSEQVAVTAAVINGDDGRRKVAAKINADGGRPPRQAVPASRATTSAVGAAGVYHAPASIDCPQCRKPRDGTPAKAAPRP